MQIGHAAGAILDATVRSENPSRVAGGGGGGDCLSHWATIKVDADATVTPKIEAIAKERIIVAGPIAGYFEQPAIKVLSLRVQERPRFPHFRAFDIGVL